MRGFIFTLDAVFAAAIAAMAITLLLYTHFTLSPAGVPQAITAYSAIKAMSSETIGAFCSNTSTQYACNYSAVKNGYYYSGYLIPSNASVLAAITMLYKNSRTFYASLIASSFINFTNTGIYINKIYAPQISTLLPSFTGSNYVLLPVPISQRHPVAISAWVYLPSVPTGNAPIFTSSSTYAYGTISVFFSGGSLYFGTANNGGTSYSQKVPYQFSPGQWYNIIGWLNSSYNLYGIYINGNPVAKGNFGGTSEAASYIDIAYSPYSSSYFQGSIANVQIYSTNITAREASLIYRRGLYGAPANYSRLAAWYPLNGNTNDFTGLNGQGTFSGASYSNSYSKLYTPASLAAASEVSQASCIIPLGSPYSGYNFSVIIWH
ncbi:MAG: LamG domain-containing protein [Candidatus Micrarchaeia archaeon]